MKNEMAIKRLERHLLDNPKDARVHYELAGLLAQAENYRNAILEYEKSLLLDPSNIKARMELGVIYSRTGQLEQAVKEWKKMQDEDGDLVIDFSTPQRTSELTSTTATRMWDKFREDPTDSPVKDFTLGFANMILGRTDRAIMDFKSAIVANPRLEMAHFFKGLCHFLKKEYQFALPDFIEEIGLRPRFASAFYYAGLTMIEMGQTSQAMSKFQRALEENPRYLKANFQMGCLYSRQGNYPRAIEYLEKTLVINPRYFQAHFQLAQVYEKQYQMEKSAEQYEKTLRIEPDFKDANFHLGLLYKNMGKPDTAMQYFKKTLDLDPFEGEAHFYLGFLYLQKNDYNNAIQKFQDAIKIMPQHVQAQYTLGMTYFKIGNLEEAIKRYVKALQLSPSDTKIQNSLGMAYLKSGKYKEARETFRQVLATNPKDTFAFYNLGMVCCKLGDHSSALDSFLKLSQMSSSEDFSCLVKGVQYLRESDFGLASMEMEKFCEKLPSSEQELSLYATLQMMALSSLEQAQKTRDYTDDSHKSHKLLEGLIQVMAKIVDEKIPGNKGHSQRVGKIAYIIAKNLDVDEEECQMVSMAGTLHDIGKLMLGDGIISKPPGSLSPEEEQILMDHPRAGYFLLSGIPDMKEMGYCILYHHERFDGKGYPKGLRDEGIPPGAQILSIADFWDNTIHKKKVSPKQAMEFIKRLTGKMFSPEIAEALLQSVDEILLL